MTHAGTQATHPGPRRLVALTIAGVDPSGGAGLEADLKTFHQHGVYGSGVVTLLTVQNTRSVARVEPLLPELVAQQLDHLLDDLTPDAVKCGALGSAAIVEVVAARAPRLRGPLVVDPVMLSKHDQRLLDDQAAEALTRHLLPRTALLTPNAPEAAALCGRPVQSLEQAKEAARRLADLGPRAVLVKGGHLTGPHAIDVLFVDGALLEVPAHRIATVHTHGTGCAYSAAIAARLAGGLSVIDAVVLAKRWLTQALQEPALVGGGINPLNHFAPLPDAFEEPTGSD